MTSVDDFSDCGHDIADVVNYRRALAQRLSIVMMELDIGSVQPEEVRTYLYICTLLQRLCRPRKHLHHVDPVGHRAGSFPTDRQRPNVVTRQCGGRQQAGMCQSEVQTVSPGHPLRNRTEQLCKMQLRVFQEVSGKKTTAVVRDSV
jgi:hypothetical protein